MHLQRFTPMCYIVHIVMHTYYVCDNLCLVCPKQQCSAILIIQTSFVWNLD